MHKIKHPRTYHLPWSEGIHSDDKIIKNTSQFDGMEVVVPEKMDGESTSMYTNYIHARSVDSRHNFTQDWARKLQSILSPDIPDGYLFTFENVSYYHSIEYNNLESFCYLLFIWQPDGMCLSYDDQCQWAEVLDLAQPQVFYKGVYDEDILKKLTKELDLNTIEGYVIRNAKSFHRDEFEKNVGKFVRKNHIQPNHENGMIEHWLKNTKPNKLANPEYVKPATMMQKNNKLKF